MLDWKILFKTLWSKILIRCRGTISHIQNLTSLLEKEGLAYQFAQLHKSIVQLSKSKEIAQQERLEKEHLSALAKYQSVLSWLNVDHSEQSDILDTLTAYPGTCNWVLGHPRFESWLKDEKEPTFWISGKPGSGTICSIR